MWAEKQLASALQQGTFAELHTAVLHPLGTDSIHSQSGRMGFSATRQWWGFKLPPIHPKARKSMQDWGIPSLNEHICTCRAYGGKAWPKPQALAVQGKAHPQQLRGLGKRTVEAHIPAAARFLLIHQPQLGTSCPHVSPAPSESLFAAPLRNTLWESLWI